MELEKIKDVVKFKKNAFEINSIDLQLNELYDYGAFDEEELKCVLYNYMLDKLLSHKVDSEIIEMIEGIIDDEEFDEDFKKELGLI